MQKCINKSELGCMNFIKFLKERMDLFIIMRIYRHYTILLHIDQIEYILNNYTLKNLCISFFNCLAVKLAHYA